MGGWRKRVSGILCRWIMRGHGVESAASAMGCLVVVGNSGRGVGCFDYIADDGAGERTGECA